MASGQLYSYKYGFGQLNAYAYIQAAQDWQLVKPQAWFHPAAIQLNNGTLLTEDGNMEGGQAVIPGGVTSSFLVTQEMLDAHNFEGLEHVTVRVWISHTKRGDVEVELTSPHGIRSVLAAKRDYDRATSGFRGWRFMSIKHWYDNFFVETVFHVINYFAGVKALLALGQSRSLINQPRAIMESSTVGVSCSGAPRSTRRAQKPTFSRSQSISFHP